MSLERRRSYLRGFSTVNCNGVRTNKAKIAIFLLLKTTGPYNAGKPFFEAFRRLIVIILRRETANSCFNLKPQESNLVMKLWWGLSAQNILGNKRPYRTGQEKLSERLFDGNLRRHILLILVLI